MESACEPRLKDLPCGDGEWLPHGLDVLLVTLLEPLCSFFLCIFYLPF